VTLRINEILAKRLNLRITPATQSATQADGISDLSVVGETRFSVQRGNITLYFEGLVVRGLETGILAGVPFMEENDIGVRPKFKEISIGEKKLEYKVIRPSISQAIVSRVSSQPLVCNANITLYPSEFIDLPSVGDKLDASVLVQANCNNTWLNTEIAHKVEGMVRLTNSSSLPVNLYKDEHIAIKLKF
jgi:hypothetical protein